MGPDYRSRASRVVGRRRGVRPGGAGGEEAKRRGRRFASRSPPPASLLRPGHRPPPRCPTPTGSETAPMFITFHGAARTVTGSMHLVEANGAKLLLDCGLYQGKRQ